MRCERIGNSSMLFVCALFRGDTLLVSGELVYVFADPATQTSRPVPPELRALFEGFEAGAPVLDVRVGTWDTLGREAQAIRTAVFVDEQKIPAELEWDAADATAVHAVAFNRFGLAVATGRWLDVDAGTAKIGRMAVAQPLRGSGVGRRGAACAGAVGARPGQAAGAAARAGECRAVLPARRLQQRGRTVRGSRHRAPGDGAAAVAPPW